LNNRIPLRTNGENRRCLGIEGKFTLLSAYAVFVSRIIKNNIYGKGNYDIRAAAQGGKRAHKPSDGTA
jgi:hypothetical protein